MKLIADIHTHTIASGHAYGTIREMAQAASERGLQMIGFTEHAPGTPGTTDPFYFRNLKVVPRSIYGVEIVHGCEVNVLEGGRLSLSESDFKYLDYAIAGIHTICYEDQGIAGNTENLIACMRHPKIKLVSHPDDDHTPLDYPAVVEAAREYHVALEVNNSSLTKPKKRLNCRENYRTMLALCAKMRVPVIVSSDAHDPSWVGEFALAEAMLADYGFDESLVLNADLEKLRAFLLGSLPALSEK